MLQNITKHFRYLKWRYWTLQDCFGMGFPLHKPYIQSYSLYIGEYLHFRYEYLKCLVKTWLQNHGYDSWYDSRVWFGVWFEHACGHKLCIRHFWKRSYVFLLLICYCINIRLCSGKIWGQHLPATLLLQLLPAPPYLDYEWIPIIFHVQVDTRDSH